MLLLNAAEVEEEGVELGVGDLGQVEHVVRVLVVADLLAQLLCHGGRLGRLRGLLGRGLLLGHFVSGASMPDKILSPTLSNLITSSSSVRVRVLLTTMPLPNAGCDTRSPLENRWTGGAAGAACTWSSWYLSLYPWRGGATGALPRGADSIACGISVRKRLGNAGCERPYRWRRKAQLRYSRSFARVMPT